MADGMSLASGTTTRGRNFAGVVGLKPGYGDSGNPFERSVIIETWKSWVRARIKAKEPYLGMIASPVQDLNYVFEEDGGPVFYDEPVVVVHAEIASYQEHLSDDQVVEALTSLFTEIGQALQQTTVRFLYHGDNGSRQSYRLRLPNTFHPLDSGSK